MLGSQINKELDGALSFLMDASNDFESSMDMNYDECMDDWLIQSIRENVKKADKLIKVIISKLDDV